ncbi:hypothetical protein [Nonomuraea diastatica]|uniref:WD40 repeat domain-containing protein n=1 Tax=Nonomuraea diastatica TaxID=1848329 RepID=A0A4R4VBW9_9ACTN|nr:hypothetical protein [Nonomuraea diastatica]TDD02682.1 hypothetical protein E1294_51090 [Nonomuraea diastatica]
MQPELITERALSPERGPRRCADGTWQVPTLDLRLLVFDSCFQTLRQVFDLPWEGQCSVSTDLQRVAVAGLDQIAMVALDGRIVWRVSHHAWGPRLGAVGSAGSCAFSPDGSQVWVVVPQHEHDVGGDQCWVLDAVTGDVLDRVPLGCSAYSSSILPHPDGRHLLLDLGAPYEVGWIGSGRWDSGRAAVFIRRCDYEVLADLHPSGDRYLTTPIEDDKLTVRRFPDGAVQAVRQGREVFEGDVGFDLAGGFLDTERVIAKEFEGQTSLFTADTLDMVDVIDYPSDAVTEEPLPDGRGVWSTFDFRIGRLQVWKDPSVPGPLHNI